VESGNESVLRIDFAGEIHDLGPGDELTFGRSVRNDLVIDEDNVRLHRRFGRVYHRDSGWWLANTGSKLPLTVLDRESRSRVELTPGRDAALTFAHSTITFSAGTTSYEILVDIQGPDDALNDLTDDATTTGLTIDQIPLVGEQRLLAVGLCEVALRNPHQGVSLPSNKAVANRFGWPMTTFNRKLDRLCRRYADQGVPGLVGKPGQLATDRRRKLVEHLINTSEITEADLELLDADVEE